MTALASLAAPFGDIDVYVFDQIQRGRIADGMRILDAGCGGGRNLEVFLRSGVEAHGADRDPETAARARTHAAEVAPAARARFLVAEVGALPYAGGSFDCVILNAVLHFARTEADFDRMVQDAWRVTAPGGLFFARLASDIGIEDRVRRLDGRWSELPDGTERFLVDEALLVDTGQRLGGALLDPIKTTNVQNLRCMSTWVLRKDA